jgi:23S rRNA pseudouridine1911/1915/1917 synthase
VKQGQEARSAAPADLGATKAADIDATDALDPSFADACLGDEDEVPGEGPLPARERSFSAVVPAQARGMRLDSYLGATDAFASRSAAAHGIERGLVCVNGAVADSKRQEVRAGDRIEVRVPVRQADEVISGERIPLDIRFEDEHLIVLSKQRGLVCHPAPGHESHTLANALVYHCGLDHLGRLQGDDRPGIVHRLDQDTTGLMLAAKSDDVQRALQGMIRLRTVDRRYIALVHGEVPSDTGMIDAPIARSTRDRLRMAVSEDPAARQAITTFSVLERFEPSRGDEGYTLVECHLFTGRTHQIRVHMAYARHPVVGDQLYGRGTLERNLGLDRQFLHSWSITFDHPVTGERMHFVDEPTDELLEALESIEARSAGRTERGEQVASELDRFRSAREHAEWASWF